MRQVRSFAGGSRPSQFLPNRPIAKLDSLPQLSDYPGKAMWGATMDVGEWLRGLGLDQYEAKFRDNKIDAEVLPQLTADDLKEIGVVAVGDRRKLLAAISAMVEAIRSEHVDL